MRSSEAVYWEAHVTIEPVFDERREELERVSKFCGWKLAELLMQRSREAVPERSNKDSFLTKRGTSEGLSQDMYRFVEQLQEAGFKVWRFKLEACYIDQRIT